jgi:outer membrane receptor protein involved in Fe transport
VPNGRASLPAATPLPPGAPTTTAGAYYGCSATHTNQVTRIPGAAGTSYTDYECLHGAYNYQPFNLIMTPSERGSFFTTSSYHLTDDLSVYAEVLFNKTHSGFEIAPLPFDASADDVIISGTNAYNPFGLDFGGTTTLNPNYRTRFVTLGDRKSKADSDSKITNFGLRGKLPWRDWQFDANLGYNREDQTQHVQGYVYFPGLQNEVGPSFTDPATGALGCGTDPAHAIPGCTPINFFNLDDPATISQLQQLSTSYLTNNSFVYKSASIDLNGSLFTLPAGDVMGAIGFQYQSQRADYTVDYLVQALPPLYIKCLISEEACSGNSSGKYDSREVYLEALVPILKDAPLAKSLNVDVGVRFSNYSLFGSATKAQFKIEYKPIDTLLLRGTFAQVFRVPTLIDLFAAPLNTSSTYADPCYGVTAAAVAANPNLGKTCQGAALDGSYGYNGTAQVTGLILSNPNLKPETGNVWTAGFVLQVPFVENLSVTMDYWNYDINDIITNLDPNYSSEQCLATGADAFCGLIHRYPAGNNQGQVLVFEEPTVNLGELKTNGIDIDIGYRLTGTSIGNFRFDLAATHLNSYESIPLPGAPAQEIAGTFDRQFGNYAKWRGLGTINWSLQGFDAMLQAQYIDSVVIHNPATQNFALFGQPNPDLHVGSVVYLNATLGYTVKKTNTKVQFGMQNITDKQPPIMYMNNVTNSNTDVATYDLLGRRFFVSFVQKF